MNVLCSLASLCGGCAVFRSQDQDRPMTAIEWKAKDAYEKVQAFTDGAEGRTSLYRSQSSGKLVVLKRLHCDAYRALQNGQPWEAEILLNALGHHPNIVEMLAAERSRNGLWTLALEYCSGGCLFDQLNHFAAMNRAQYGRYPIIPVSPSTATKMDNMHFGALLAVPEVFVFHVFISLLDALAYLHEGLRRTESGQYTKEADHVAVIHCDMKPDNVLLSWDNPASGLPTIKLADFGGSRLAQSSRGLSGTTIYFAPESEDASHDRELDLRLQRVLTPKTDIYGLGLVVFECATYRLWRMRTDVEKMELPGSYSGRMNSLMGALKKCLIQHPDDRADARELLGVMTKLRAARAELMAGYGALPRRSWKSPPA